MQRTTEEEAEASVTTDNVREGSPNLNRTVTLRRKAAKRTFPWDLTPEELHILSPLQAEDVPVAKKPRLEVPISGSKDEATTHISSHDTAVILPAADYADAVKGPHTVGHWTAEEDAKLNIAVNTYCKKKGKYGKQYRTNWAAVAELVPTRTQIQCQSRWFHPSVDRAIEHRCKWTAVEDSKLKAAVDTHGGKNWSAIAALLHGQTKKQCLSRWRHILEANGDRAIEPTGKWTAAEDSKLKAAVDTHDGKNWGAIAALVPGRTQAACRGRWHQHILNFNIVRTTGRTGKWADAEDSKLTAALQKHGDRNWDDINALVPGRTTKQRHNRWHQFLKPSIDQTKALPSRWTAVEDSKLKAAVDTHCGKNWGAIAALIPARTTKQCMRRWNCCLKPNIDRATRRSGTWTEDEDITLRHAVQMQDVKNSKDWVAIAALVPGRTKKQCWSRWDHLLDPNIDRMTGSSGTWTAVEDSKLKDSVEKHGGKDWAAITALVPGRTKIQCTSRWHDFLKHSIVVASGRTGKWTEDEDKKLKDSVDKHGYKDWVLIATLVSSRTKKQCRNRWQNCLKPSIDRATEDEDTN
jgi:hypothetical protein